MKEESLHEFYEYVILPQFGLIGKNYEWILCEKIGWDDEVHFFNCENEKYALIFRDNGGMSKEEIKEILKLEKNQFEYIFPKSKSFEPPFYNTAPPTPFQHAHNVTGTFTLIKIIK